MRVRGIRWLGTPTARYAETVAFARDVLGLRLTLEQDDFAVFETENGDVFEVFGPKGIASAVQLARKAVDEGMIERMTSALEAAGALKSAPAASVASR